MKVLMLGWEFPPHISGGLGTACFGLTQGLSHHGVEVHFVVPRAHGDEDSRFVKLRGGNQVLISSGMANAPPGDPRRSDFVEHASGLGGSALAGEPGAATGMDDEAEESARASAGMRITQVDALLRPYLTAESYRAERWPAEAGVLVEDGWPQGAGAPRSKEDWIAFVRGVGEQYRVGRHMEQRTGRGVEHLASRKRRTRARSNGGSGGQVVGGQDVAGGGGSPRYFEFSGTYGPGLMEEVARYAIAIAEIARTESFDVIHAHDWMTFPAGAAAARVSGKPLVIHVHACEYDRSGEHVNADVKAVEQLGLEAADRIICVSYYTTTVLRKYYDVDPARLRVVHNAVTRREHQSEAHWEKPIPDPIVLFLGRVTFQKGPDYFLDAAARVVKIRPDVKFVMSGSGDMLPSMVERAARLGLARHVHFTGFLRGDDVERIYAMADLYVMPSVSEPFGISPLEAMALDVPVIVSRQSGVSEILRNALKVDFWDVQDLANKILAVLKYPALRTQLTEEGRDEVALMRWDIRASLVRDVYREMVA